MTRRVTLAALLAVALFTLTGCGIPAPENSQRRVPASLQRHAKPPVGENTDLRVELHAPKAWRPDFDKNIDHSMSALFCKLAGRNAHGDEAWLGVGNLFLAGKMKKPDYFSWHTLFFVKKTPNMVEFAGSLTTWERTRVGIWPVPLYDNIGAMKSLCVEAIVRFDLRSMRDTQDLERIRNFLINNAGR